MNSFFLRALSKYFSGKDGSPPRKNWPVRLWLRQREWLLSDLLTCAYAIWDFMVLTRDLWTKLKQVIYKSEVERPFVRQLWRISVVSPDITCRQTAVCWLRDLDLWPLTILTVLVFSTRIGYFVSNIVTMLEESNRPTTYGTFWAHVLCSSRRWPVYFKMSQPITSVTGRKMYILNLNFLQHRPGTHGQSDRQIVRSEDQYHYRPPQWSSQLRYRSRQLSAAPTP